LPKPEDINDRVTMPLIDDSGIATAPDDWALAAAHARVAFSQVREDPRLDEEVLRRLGPDARVFMIASGGDTAAALVAGGRVGRLQLVDFNPAQLVLTQIKLHLLRHSSPAERLAVLGHSRMQADRRADAIETILEAKGAPHDVFGEMKAFSELGPDRAGRYEILFHHLRARLRPHQSEIAELFALSDPIEQALRVAQETPLGLALDEAFHSVMRLENLVCLFGDEATRNARISFSQHFAEQTRRAFSMMPARENPFLAQLLLGEFVNGATYDWLQRPSPNCWPEILYTRSTALDALAALPPGSVDFVHLSNILDWLSPGAAAHTLGLAWRALRPGGVTIIRQLNSTLDIEASERRFAWRQNAADLHRRDRSFFYRGIFVGEKVDQA
jgi:S-adenosylmethionine-diacylglycerol 3-amino-3-carboxypropyl transferase